MTPEYLMEAYSDRMRFQEMANICIPVRRVAHFKVVSNKNNGKKTTIQFRIGSVEFYSTKQIPDHWWSRMTTCLVVPNSFIGKTSNTTRGRLFANFEQYFVGHREPFYIIPPKSTYHWGWRNIGSQGFIFPSLLEWKIYSEDKLFALEEYGRFTELGFLAYNEHDAAMVKLLA